MTTFGLAINADFRAAGESWIQNNESNYVWPKIPWVLTNGPRNGWGRDTTYRLPVFEQFMGTSAQGNNYEPGATLPGTRDLKDAPVTISHQGKATDGLSIPIARDGKVDRMADAEMATEGLMAEAYLMREVGLVSHLLTAGIGAGNALSFSGTDPLLVPDSDGTRNIIGDIIEALDPQNSIRMMGLKLVCFTNRRMLDILRRQPDFHGAGANGSGGGSGAGKAGLAEANRLRFIDAFQSQFDLDEVHVFNVAVNGAAKGAAASVGAVNGNAPFLAFRLVDDRRNRIDMTGSMPDPKRAPDGGLVGNCEVWRPFITRETSENKETTTYYGKDGFGYEIPRADATLNGGVNFGCFFTGNITS